MKTINPFHCPHCDYDNAVLNVGKKGEMSIEVKTGLKLHVLDGKTKKGTVKCLKCEAEFPIDLNLFWGR